MFHSVRRVFQKLVRVNRCVGAVAGNSFGTFTDSYVKRLSSMPRILIGVAAASALGAMSLSSSSSAMCESRTFEEIAFPQSKMITDGYIRVSDRHKVYYHVYGNPKGKPVLFVHGGPGGGTQPNMSRFFDPEAYMVILVDQRGCGKSTPFADLTDNTTWDSVRDFERVRMKLGIEKWMVFGGSWGATLSLAYSQVHPERVTELVLRGVFLLREKEVKFFYQHGSSFFFPDEWEKYEAEIPEEERGDYVAAYGKRLRGELGEEAMRSAAKAWSIWEGRTCMLIPSPWENVKAKYGADDFSLAFARIENHYFTNKGFFPRDGYLIEKENIDRIRHIPTTIVQGRYDSVCPLRSAWDLKKAFPEADLNIVTGGHSSMDPPITAGLVEATNKYKHNQ